jgi:AraC-like DNA-binding protein
MAGMSPFHFNRVFVSSPVSRRIDFCRVRLTAARRMQLDGVSVTGACYDSGFASVI